MTHSCQNNISSYIFPVMASSSTTQTIAYPRQNYDYFLVLDFEATCDNQTKLNPSEIIEFPVLKINGQTFQCESVFHTCKVKRNN